LFSASTVDELIAAVAAQNPNPVTPIQTVDPDPRWPTRLRHKDKTPPSGRKHALSWGTLVARRTEALREYADVRLQTDFRRSSDVLHGQSGLLTARIRVLFAFASAPSKEDHVMTRRQALAFLHLEVLVMAGMAVFEPVGAITRERGASARSASTPPGQQEERRTRPGGTAEGEIFARTRGSVFVVETEAGHGSGFLVDGRGFVLTNDHVLGTSPYVAIGIDINHKYPAAVIARDASRDIALIRLHPRAVAGVLPLHLANPDTAPRIGDRVLAIGSALVNEGSVLTTGVVARVTPDTILADLTVNPGNSGGPLLDLEGEVLGINTFHSKAIVGPGLAGIVRIAESLLAAIKDGDTREPPPYVQLPVASASPYPAAALQERAAAIRNPSAYRHQLGAVRIDVLTPPLAYFEAHEAELRKDGGQGHAYDWKSKVGSVEAIVGIRAMFDPGYPFRGMRLLRDGVEVVPIVPGLICESREVADRQPPRCIGLYQYDPEAFEPGATLELRVFTKPAPDRGTAWKLENDLVRRVWCDFEPWLANQRPLRMKLHRSSTAMNRGSFR